MSFEIKEAKTDEDFLACWEVVSSLRTHIKKEDFLPLVHDQLKENYHLLYVLDPDTGKVVSYLGYRVYTMLYYGKALYIEDLATLPEARARGYAGAMVSRVKEIAKEVGCDGLAVDCYVMRFNSHRFYLNQGFSITGHHFENGNL